MRLRKERYKSPERKKYNTQLRIIIAIAILDVVTTLIALEKFHSSELNPIANIFIKNLGNLSLVPLKFIVITALISIMKFFERNSTEKFMMQFSRIVSILSVLAVINNSCAIIVEMSLAWT